MKRGEKERRIIALLSQEPMGARALAEFGEMPFPGIYPILMALEDAGTIISLWADGEPRRRIYRMPGT